MKFGSVPITTRTLPTGVQLQPGGVEMLRLVSAARIDHLAQSLEPPSASIVLTGDPGCGKSHLARQAAYAFAEKSVQPVQQLLVRQFADLLQLSGDTVASPPQQVSGRMLDALKARFPGHEAVIVAFNIDRYHGDEAAVIDHLVRARQARFIGTAQQVVGAADLLSRDPGVTLEAVSPLTIDESGAFLAKLLGVDQFAQQSLEDWYAATLGNPHALATLAIAAERRGAIHRARRIAWITPREDRPPADFVAQLEVPDPLERAALELIAFADPLHEPALLQLLDTDAVTRLLNRHVIVVRTDAAGVSALATRLPILAAAIREHLAPATRTAIATLCYHALLSDDATLTTASRRRLVRFGLAAGRELPADWMWQAMRAAGHSGELNYTLRLALAAMSHEDPRRAAEAILRACDLAHFLDVPDALDDALLALDALVGNTPVFGALPFEMQFTLAVTSICLSPVYAGAPELALEALDEWERHWESHGVSARHATQACRMRVLALNGQLREALTAVKTSDGGPDLNSAWISAPARTYEALILAQKGQFRSALSLAESVRRIIMLHEISPTISGDLEGFVIFVAHWARGTTAPARRTLEQIAATNRADLSAVQSRTGLMGLGAILFSLQEARWNDAAELADQLLSNLAGGDPTGITPLVYTTAALAYAALGESDRAWDALFHGETFTHPGVSFALHGFLSDLALRTRQWLRDPDLVARAHELAEWAQAEELPLVELKALDVVAYESTKRDPALLARAEELALLVDQPVGPAILAHIKAMSGPNDGDEDPDERLLSELGIWMPLPPVSNLTGREREISLFTALGYSSKYIAERLQLSARTVETHLTHVYTKLNLDGREELRDWFSRSRERQ